MRQRSGSGFSLVELMVVVAILGVLAAIAIPTFGRYVRRARSAEAAGHVGKLWSGAVSYYLAGRSAAGGADVARQFPGPLAPAESSVECGCLPTRLCPGGSAIWNDQVWTALLFAVSDAHHFIPRFESSGVDHSAAFTARATADLDCDGIVQTFERQGSVSAAAGEVIGPVQPAVTNENE